MAMAFDVAAVCSYRCHSTFGMLCIAVAATLLLQHSWMHLEL